MTERFETTIEADPQTHTWDSVLMICILCGAPMSDDFLSQRCKEQVNDSWVEGIRNAHDR